MSGQLGTQLEGPAKMQFPFRLAAALGAPSSHSGQFVGCIDDRRLREDGRLASVLDALGEKSALAQGLRKPVTFGASLYGQRIYLLVERSIAMGFIKIGTKHLFVEPPPRSTHRHGQTSTQDSQNLREVSPVCVLDFYVHESCQRAGHGRRLFEAMLADEGLGPAQLAYDRPSPKLISFLRKHYGLHRFQPQNNNFVVFDEFFEHGSERSVRDAHTGGRRSHPGHAARGVELPPSSELAARTDFGEDGGATRGVSPASHTPPRTPPSGGSRHSERTRGPLQEDQASARVEVGRPGGTSGGQAKGQRDMHALRRLSGQELAGKRRDRGAYAESSWRSSGSLFAEPPAAGMPSGGIARA